MNSDTHISTVIDKIAAGDVALGGIVTFGDSAVTEVLATSGFDFIWIDMEHSPIVANRRAGSSRMDRTRCVVAGA